MWQAKTCILEMFLDFYGAYSGNKSNYRDFLKDILTFYEKHAVGQKPQMCPPRQSYANENIRGTTGFHRIHNNIFDIAARQSLTFEMDSYGGGSSAPLPRISGLCTARGGPDVDIDLSLPASRDEVEVTAATVEEIDELPDRSESVVEVVPPYHRHVKSEPDIWEPQVSIAEPPHPVISHVHHRAPLSPFRHPPPAKSRHSASSVHNNSGDSARYTPSKGSRMKTGVAPAQVKSASVVCNICHRQMTSYRALIRHRSRLHSHRPVGCPRCKKKFVSRATLQRHFQRQSCRGANDEVSSFHDHFDAEVEAAAWPEPVSAVAKPKASRRVSGESGGARLPALDAALRRKKGKSRRAKGRSKKKKRAGAKSPERSGQRCTITNCRQHFANRADYLEHLQIKHSDRTALLCDTCEKVFLSARHWRLHLASHREQLVMEAHDHPPELEPELVFEATSPCQEDVV